MYWQKQIRSSENKLDAFHMTQLGWVLGIQYLPKHVIVINAYTKSAGKFASQFKIQVMETRWRLFGNMVRRDPEIPTKKLGFSMMFYFMYNDKQYKGRATAIFSVILKNNPIETWRQHVKTKQSWTSERDCIQNRVLSTRIKKMAEPVVSASEWQ